MRTGLESKAGVGAELVVRQPGGRRPAELTEAGRALLVYADEMLAKTEAAHGEVVRLASGESGLVAVATIQSIGERILPGAIARFRSLRPNASRSARKRPPTRCSAPSKRGPPTSASVRGPCPSTASRYTDLLNERSTFAAATIEALLEGEALLPKTRKALRERYLST
jgi:hypothetical protein